MNLVINKETLKDMFVHYFTEFFEVNNEPERKPTTTGLYSVINNIKHLLVMELLTTKSCLNFTTATTFFVKNLQVCLHYITYSFISVEYFM